MSTAAIWAARWPFFGIGSAGWTSRIDRLVELRDDAVLLVVLLLDLAALPRRADGKAIESVSLSA